MGRKKNIFSLKFHTVNKKILMNVNKTFPVSLFLLFYEKNNLKNILKEFISNIIFKQKSKKTQSRHLL